MNTQIYEEASNWFVDFRSGDVDPAARKRFDAWLRKSPEHLRAYLEVTEIWQDAADVGTTHDSGTQDLTARALADENVVHLNAAAQPPEPEPAADTMRARPPVRSPVRSLATMLAAAVLLAILGTWFYVQRNTYSTGTGEQRTVVLADGSIVRLNALSRIEVHYSSHTRHIDLLAGQALFRVAKNKERPFMVHSGTTLVRAVGTQFDVYRRRAGTVVTVLEGNVVVTAPGPTGPRAAQVQRSPLAAGEQLIVRRQAISAPAPVDVASVTAWTQRRLVFNHSTLGDVVEEFNRYNTRPLVIEAPALADFQISGIYASTDPTLLMRFLAEQPGIRIRETDAAIVIESAR